jgi:Protein-glutamine gamma-glutamyltransferase
LEWNVSVNDQEVGDDKVKFTAIELQSLTVTEHDDTTNKVKATDATAKGLYVGEDVGGYIKVDLQSEFSDGAGKYVHWKIVQGYKTFEGTFAKGNSINNQKFKGTDGDLTVTIFLSGEVDVNEKKLQINVVDLLPAIRIKMVAAAESNIMRFRDESTSDTGYIGPNGDRRNPAYWTDNGNEYVVKAGVAPHIAIEDMWNTYHDSATGLDFYPRTGCKKLAEIIYLKAVADLCIQMDAQYGNTSLIDKFDEAVGHGSISDLFNSTFKWNLKSNSDGFDIDKLSPGDRTWIKNPYWSGADDGTEGSNEIYIGGGQFQGFYNRFFSSLADLQTYVRTWSGNPNAPLSVFKITRVYQPTVPSFMKY